MLKDFLRLLISKVSGLSSGEPGSNIDKMIRVDVVDGTNEMRILLWGDEIFSASSEINDKNVYGETHFFQPGDSV